MATYNFTITYNEDQNYTFNVNGEPLGLVEESNFFGSYYTYETLTFEENEEITVTVVANEGWAFEGETELSQYNTQTGSYDNYELVGSVTERKTTLIMNQDYDLNVYIDTVVYEPPEVEDFPFIHMYEVTDEQLDELNAYRFNELMGAVDFGQYIMNLIQIPFSIPQNEATEVLIGGEVTDVYANPITNYTITKSLGSIFIDQYLEDGIKFEDIEFTLFAPYFRRIKLDIDEVLETTIRLELVLNLLNGYATLNIYNENTNSLIDSRNTSISQEIPYRIGETLQSYSSQAMLMNGVEAPFIEAKMKIPSNELVLVDSQMQMVDFRTNFLQVGYVQLESKATKKEQEEIQTLLSNGVYVYNDYS